MTDAERVSKIAIRYWNWVNEYTRAEKHARGCKQCKTVDDGENVQRVSCPQAPPFPPIDYFTDLR